MSNTVSTNPEVLAEFSIELGKYIEQICEKIMELRGYHNRAADFWQGPQYDSLSDGITQMSQRVLEEAEKLENLRQFIAQKALELANAQGIFFGDDE